MFIIGCLGPKGWAWDHKY